MHRKQKHSKPNSRQSGLELRVFDGAGVLRPGYEDLKVCVHTTWVVGKMTVGEMRQYLAAIVA
jgi:hypothetical protein